jgi:hypothetical protein
MTDAEVREWAVELAMEDVKTAARSFFQLHPELREIKVTVLDDGAAVVRAEEKAAQAVEAVLARIGKGE